MQTTSEKIERKFENGTLLIIRLIVAVVFLFAVWAKLFLWTSPPPEIAGMMLLLIRFVSIAEPLGAIALIFGFLTRWAASGLAIIMVGAILVLHFTMGTHFFTTLQGLGWDYNLFILGNCLTLMTFGAGRFSIDVLLAKK